MVFILANDNKSGKNQLHKNKQKWLTTVLD